MRPLSIAVEGFFAYRKRAEIDLADVEYFSLEGPTGSGKSSLIDAMIFALYGRVPRLGGGTVAPVISAGADRARVSFDFIAEGEIHSATRLVQRTKSGGASTVEARLESGDSVIASGAAEVTRAVSEILRLSFDDFTRTVVLPQGDFARFLKAPPAERQQLLRSLLGLDLYGKVRVAAQTREKVERSTAQSINTRLDGLEVPSSDTRKAVLDRHRAIEQLAAEVTADEEKLDRLRDRQSGLEKSLNALQEARERLTQLTAPPRLDELSDLVSSTASTIEKLNGCLDAILTKRKSMEEIIGQLPDVQALDRLSGLYERLSEIDSEPAADELASIESELAEAEAKVVIAAGDVDRVRSDLEESRVAHAAHAIAVQLEVGEPCPVCAHVVATLPEIDLSPDLDAAASASAKAEAALDTARQQVLRLSSKVAELRATAQHLKTKREEVVADLGESDLPEDKIPLAREALAKAKADLMAIQTEQEGLEHELRSMRDEMGDLVERQRSLGNLLMAEREKVADLKPDLAVSDDPLVLWKELLLWRDRKLIEIASDIGDKTEEMRAAAAELESARSALVGRLELLNILPEWPCSAAVARAHEKSRQVVESHDKVLEQFERLKDELSETEEKGRVAAALASHLRSDGFERWLMLGAISDLTLRANTLLSQLSEDGYSLRADEDGSFDIVDHRNADELRPISTLSGGETFMVSLALALSLAETLSAGGGGRLDAIILDEGFGTLDEESLDIVAGVLEGLNARGLMVGIITHVKELAARAPVRFQVRKGPDGSKVELLL